jgi:3-hydroxyisobutyrate dehydrogenase
MLAAMTRIAFVGLGTMGRHMAANLLAAGHELVACDVDPAPAAALGIPFAASPAAAAAGADVAIMSLPSPAVVEEVAVGPAGLLHGARPGAVVVDMSTSPPSLARRLAAAFEAAGVDSLDAPVSGGPAGAEAATLAIMAGGRREAFERVRPVLESMGSLVELVGGAGAGQAVKLCNNLIVGVTMAAMAEACALLEQEGIDPAQAYEVFTRSTSDSSVLRRRFPIGGVRPEHPASKGYEPLFRLDLLRKDLALALELAAEHGIPVTVTEVAAGVYDEALEAGLGGLDYSAVYRKRRP